MRNRIYETVFSPEWVKAAMPADRGRQLAAATLAAAFAGVSVWYAAFQPRPYEEAFRAAIQDNGYNGALAAYTELRANPFSRSRATELMQEFWEQRNLTSRCGRCRILTSMKPLSLTEILELPVAERIRLVEIIWDSIAAVPEAVPVSAELKADLERRLGEFEADPEAGLSWQEVRERALQGRWRTG